MTGADAPDTGPLSSVRRLIADLRNPFDLAAGLSLIVLVLPAGRLGVVGTVVTGIAAAVVLITPRLRRSPWPWLAFAVLHGAFYLDAWYRLDNHDLLVAWWALALAVAAWVRRPGRDVALAIQARWILGVVFGVAALWKLLSGQFVDGSFFTHALLVDPRFREVAALLTSLTSEQVAATANATWQGIWAVNPATVELAHVSAVSGPARVFTAWGVVVEATIAIGMLGPDRPAWRRFRHLALAAFMLTTYAVVPVLRFALLLGALGVAQAGDDARWRWMFVALVGAALVWTPIWLVTLGP